MNYILENTEHKGWFYEKNEDNSYRYILGTIGKNPLICIGVNPSTATPVQLDRTLQSVQRISEINGYDSWVMLNLYPQRATNPNDMDIECNDEYNNLNYEFTKKLFDQFPNADIWAAWGTIITKRKYLKNCLSTMSTLCNKGNTWVSFGDKSKQGHPHHPLYLLKTSPKTIFDISEYLNSI